MWQTFTERAREAVFFAQEESQRFGDGYVSTEHLLLGLLRDTTCTASRSLEAAGVALARVRAEVEKQIPRNANTGMREMTMTPRAKRAINLAYDEARELKDEFIGTEHLLLGILREGDGLGAKVLEKLGFGIKVARKAVADARGRALEAPAKSSHIKVCRREESVLVVIDLQDSFLAPVPEKERILHRCSFLIEVANALSVPILATEQYATRMGATNEAIVALMGEASRFDKMCFSACGAAAFEDEWRRIGRSQAVVIGIETHICVNQTVHELIGDVGAEVFVCGDAVGGRLADAHELALARMRGIGAIISHTESVAYEWLRQAGTPEFKSVLELVKRYN